MVQDTTNWLLRQKILEVLKQSFPPPPDSRLLFNRPAVLLALRLEGDEKRRWDDWLSKLNCPSQRVPVTERETAALAAILGKTQAELLNPTPWQSNDHPKRIDPMMQTVIDFLERESLDDGNALAARLVQRDEDEYILAGKINGFLAGGEPIPAQLCSRIAEVFRVDPQTLLPRQVSQEAPQPLPHKVKKGGSRAVRQSKKPTRARVAPQPAPEPVAPLQVLRSTIAESDGSFTLGENGPPLDQKLVLQILWRNQLSQG